MVKVKLTHGARPLPAGPFTVGTTTLQLPDEAAQRRGVLMSDAEAELLVRATHGRFKIVRPKGENDADT